MSERTESQYYEFRDFDPENARQVLSYYVDYFSCGPVLELACGPGVFLDLLRGAGIEARGVDLDPGMVEQARAAGNEVALGDAVEYLSAQPDRSLRGLFAAHFLEHLPADLAQGIYTQAARVLDEDGVFVAVVPNAACLSVLGNDFWRDPTHVRFYDPVALEFFARVAGLAVAGSGGNPRNHPGAPPQLHVSRLEPMGELTGAIRQLVDGLSTAPEPSTKPEVRDPAHIASIHAIAHLLGVFDVRFQKLQHQLAVQRDANERLLAQLYPPNEVYVVARRPKADDEAPS